MIKPLWGKGRRGPLWVAVPSLQRDRTARYKKHVTGSLRFLFFYFLGIFFDFFAVFCLDFSTVEFGCSRSLPPPSSFPPEPFESDLCLIKNQGPRTPISVFAGIPWREMREFKFLIKYKIVCLSEEGEDVPDLSPV